LPRGGSSIDGERENARAPPRGKGERKHVGEKKIINGATG